MSYLDDIDLKHVKKGKFGPLDIYPQEDKQKEDELSADFVRLGFRYNIPDQLREFEYQSIGKDQPISSNSNFDNDVIRVLLQIVNKREEASLNSQIEANKKQSVPAKVTQTFRPSLILMTGNQKTKESAYAWFKQLANNEPLIKLAKKIPVFNKRADNLPEILITLYEYQVPISRAVWYLKIMVLACSTNLTEANKKKRQPNVDVSSEWSIPLIRLLREIFNRLQFYELNPNHHGHFSSNLSLESFMNVDNLNLILLPVINENYLTEKKLKCLWNFTTKLMRSMLDQNLLDKQYLLESLVDLLEKSTSLNQQRTQSQQMIRNLNSASLESFTINKLILSTICQNMYHFLQSELLSRRLAYYCCKRISNLFNEFSSIFFEKPLKHLQIQLKASQTINQTNNEQNTEQQPTFTNEIFNYIIKNEVSISSIKSIFNKFINCSLHRDQIILLISIVHSIQLGCVQALVWNKVGDGRTESPYNGSPLDFLPCPPSVLLYTYDYMGITKRTKQYVKRELEKSELCIKRRSMAVETKWTTDKLKPVAIGSVQSKILVILDILDKYCYDLSDVNETIEALYTQIFPKLDLMNKNKNKKTNLVTNELYEEYEIETSEDLLDDSEEESNEDDEVNETNRPLSDKDIIHLLCDWATTTRRSGLQRIFYAVFLIKKRQIDLIKQIKEFNKFVKIKINKKFMKITKTNKLSELTNKQNLLDIDLMNSRKRKQMTKDDDDELDHNEMIDDQYEQASQNLSKKIKLEPLNPDEIDSNKSNNNPTTNTNTSTANIATSVKIKATNDDSKFNKSPKISKINYLNKKISYKYRLILKQKKLEEKHLYDYPYQKILFDYLDLKSSLIIENDTNNSSNLQFSNLISLFHMLITCKIFSHDQFVRDLISRGDCFPNNLNDIKRPVNVFMNFKRKQIQLKQQQQHLKRQNSQIKPTTNQPNRNSIDYPMSVDLSNPPASMPAYNLPPHTPLQHQKSLTNLNQDSLYNMAPHSVPTPCKSSITQLDQKLTIKPKPQMSKLAVYVLNLPLPQTESYQHERNQRFVILYGFGSKKQEIMDKIHLTTKMFQRLFTRKFSIDLNDSSTTITSLSNNSNSKRLNNSTNNKHFNTITNLHVCLSQSESENLAQIQKEYAKMSYYDQYSIVNKINMILIDIYKSLEQKNYLPKLQFINFIFNLMESNLNIFNLFLFCIRLLHIGPLIEQYFKNKFVLNLNSSNSNSGSNLSSSASNLNNSAQTSSSNSSNNTANPSKTYYFEYLSHFYLNIVGVLRSHLISLVLWKDLAIEVFKCLFNVVKNVERPSKCMSHEKCALSLLNEMYSSCGYIKAKFGQFEPIANKIRLEKCFTQIPQLDRNNTNLSNYQMKSDELLTSMITTTDHTIDEIENYITSKGLHYNFVAHVFLSIPNLSKDEVANLSAELTSRCNFLITFWHNSTKALHQRNTEPSRERAMFNELLSKISIQNPKCKENFKLFLSILASRHCLILNELIIMVVKTCVMACPGITNDQSHNFASLEPSASLACHIIQYLFTSSIKPHQYRRTTTEQRMISASFRSIGFNTFLLVLKCLFLLSESKKDSNSRSKSSSKLSSKEDKNNDELDLDQFAANVLQEICEHDWIKEKCFHEGDNLLKANQLLEPALGRRAQNLLHIICYPQSHELRKQNEQSSTKDFIRNILQNLDIWTLRESLLEFKLMIELEKQKERYYEYAVECLAKTTVDFLIDPEKTPTQLHRSMSQIDDNVNLNQDNDSSQAADSNENMQVDEAVNNTSLKESNFENMTESILAETDLNLNLDLEQTHNEIDEFENIDLIMNKPAQPVGIWLIAPLITRLPDTCQLKVLEHASKTLQDIGKAFWNAKNKVEKESQAIKNIIAWNQQPFFSLLVSCLKNNNNNEQQQQRILLTSLFNGLTDFINGKEDKILSEDPRIKQIIIDTLHIRLSLVGSMFDFILKNSNDFINWAWLFVQLISSGVIDPDNDQLLFTMIIDMFAVLIHHIITLEPNLDNNKHYQSIIKKISKETKDFSDIPNTKAINHIRKLMPLNRSATLDIMTVDSYSTTASKSNIHDKRRGFKFARKEKISTWELIEGVKNASSLCLSWYGSNKLERKMLRYEYQQRLLHRHKHMNIHKELTYFKEKPEVVNDLIELPEPVIVEPVKKELKQAVPLAQTQLSQVGSGANLSFNPLQTQSPATNLNESAEIVVIGSTMPNQIQHDQLLMNQSNQMNQHQIQHQLHPNHQMMHQSGLQQQQQNQQPMSHHPHVLSHPQSQMMNQPQQQHPSQMAQNHSQIMNRLQNQMQQHQQQSMMQQQQQQGHQLSTTQSMNITQTVDRKLASNRALSTPDKQKTNLTKKQKSTTPRKASNLKAGQNIAPGVQPGGIAVGLPGTSTPPLGVQSNKLIPGQQQQPQQFHQNQMLPNQPYSNAQAQIPRPGIAQTPTSHVPPQLHQRLSNQPQTASNQMNTGTNLYPNQQPPQSLTPQPPNQTQFMNQQPNVQQSQTQRMIQPQQQGQTQPNRMQTYPANLTPGQINPTMQQQVNQGQQQQQQQRKVPNPSVVPNQQKPMTGYQASNMNSNRILPQPTGTPGQQQMYQQNTNQPIYNQQMSQKQPNLAGPVQQRTSTTPDPTMVAKPNGQAYPNAQNVNYNMTNQAQGQRIPIQASQQTQRMQYAGNQPNQSQGLTIPNQTANQPAQNMNWQQQQQRQQQIQRPIQQQQQQQQQPQQFQQQYIQKQLSTNAQQQPPQGFNQNPQQRQMGVPPQQQQQQQHGQPGQQQYQNY